MTVGERVGLEGRVSYYDGVGALRDMVQNHVLQILSIIAMEPPARMDPTSVRDEKVKALRSLRPMTAETVKTHSVRGQYTPGAVGGQIVTGYADELGKPSETETFVALKAHIDNWRWQDRESVVERKSGSGAVDLGGRRVVKKKKRGREPRTEQDVQ